jgi:hypothetical protein
VESVSILIAAGDGEDAGPARVGQQMDDPVRTARVDDHLVEPQDFR